VLQQNQCIEHWPAVLPVVASGIAAGEAAHGAVAFGSGVGAGGGGSSPQGPSSLCFLASSFHALLKLCLQVVFSCAFRLIWQRPQIRFYAYSHQMLLKIFTENQCGIRVSSGAKLIWTDK